jgi:lipocalin
MLNVSQFDAADAWALAAAFSCSSSNQNLVLFARQPVNQSRCHRLLANSRVADFNATAARRIQGLDTLRFSDDVEIKLHNLSSPDI